MPGHPRPHTMATKIAYDIMKPPKELREDKANKPSETILEEWSRDLQKLR